MYTRPLKSTLSPSAEVDVMLQPIFMTSSLFHNPVLVPFVGRQATSQHPYQRRDHMLYSPPRLTGYLFSLFAAVKYLPSHQNVTKSIATWFVLFVRS
jgi:hypothetical protein